jgi:hypothetical protein
MYFSNLQSSEYRPPVPSLDQPWLIHIQCNDNKSTDITNSVILNF